MPLQKGTFDFILCTAAAAFNVGAYLKLLRPRRSFCLVGLPAVSTPLKVWRVLLHTVYHRRIDMERVV